MKKILVIVTMFLLLTVGACSSALADTEPHLLYVTRTDPINAAQYPTINRTITDVAKVQELYKAALALPIVHPGLRYECPNDNGLVYEFQYENVTTGSQMQLNATGCQFIIISNVGTRETNSTFLHLVAKDLGFAHLTDQNPTNS